jgi:5-methylcytosine-specific restriction endonuclease McrA
MAERWDTAQYRNNRTIVIAGSTHCALCGLPLTAKRWPDPDSSTADHVVPRAVALQLGWAATQINDLPNLQAAHLRCNQRRQAGDGALLARPPSPWD